MTSDLELIRLLRGELDPAHAAGLRKRLTTDSRLAVRFEAFEQRWNALGEVPDVAVPGDLRARILAAAGERPAPAPRFWGAGVAAALALGLALGFSLGRFGPPAEAPDWLVPLGPESAADAESLAEAWLAAWRAEGVGFEEVRR